MSSRALRFRGVALATLLGLPPATTAFAAAAPQPQTVAAATATAPATTPAEPRHARASLHVNLRRGNSWLGQAIPLTVTAEFRNVESVTIEGVPALKSDAIFTSNLGSEPRQATEIRDGAPVLVATWSGTLTPATAGPLGLSVELPVRIRYHERVPEPLYQQQAPDEDPFDGLDPFSAMNGLFDMDPMAPGGLQQMLRRLQRSTESGFGSQPLGRAHDDALTLKAAATPREVKPLPSAGQPPGFSGAVGRFELTATLPSSQAKVSEPLTLTATVTGEGDLDRVQLMGVKPSTEFKTYPVSAKTEPAVPGRKLGRKVFEQLLLPLHGGQVTIPPLELPVFDPTTGRYTTLTSAPLPLTVDGAPTSAPSTGLGSAAAPSGSARHADPEPLPTLPPPASSTLVPRPRALGLALAPLLGLWLGAAVWRLRSRRDREKELAKALRQTATRGRPEAFFDAARKLITCHFAKRWNVAEEAVTASDLRTKLGPAAEPLVRALANADAVRFGRGELSASELGALCSSIEASLKEVRHAPIAS